MIPYPRKTSSSWLDIALPYGHATTYVSELY
jgi:hypothetical protein